MGPGARFEIRATNKGGQFVPATKTDAWRHWTSRGTQLLLGRRGGQGECLQNNHDHLIGALWENVARRRRKAYFRNLSSGIFSRALTTAILVNTDYRHTRVLLQPKPHIPKVQTLKRHKVHFSWRITPVGSLGPFSSSRLCDETAKSAENNGDKHELSSNRH